jgi:hypothetical protein
MEGWRVRAWRVVVQAVLVLPLSSCSPPVASEDLPSADATLAAAGNRLANKLSAAELTVLATRGDRVLGALTRSERDALARGYLRFRIGKPAEVFVAAPRSSIPFWLADLRFRAIGRSFCDSDTTWAIYRKSYGPGWVGLGVNGLDRSPDAHYVVLIRAADGSPISADGLDSALWEAATAREGISLASDVFRPVRGLPAQLEGATLLRTRHDRRHATLLARGRVWKSHVVSRRTPDQVTIAFGADSSSELVWSWRTRADVARSVVRLRKAGSNREQARDYEGDSETITVPDLLNDPVVVRHRVAVSALEPATEYAYSLGDGTPEGMSAWTTVRTAPRGVSDACLLYLGDPQCGLEGWGKLLRHAYERRPDIAAILIAGDLVDRGNERTNWDHFFLRASGVLDRLPVMPCVGNHEYLDRGPWLFRGIFALPTNGPARIESDLVYSFEIADSFVAVLDSTLAVSDPSKARAQAEWLDGRLARTQRTWKLVMFHHPVYASHPSRNQPALGDAWLPVFDRHHVDLVLQGHDHAYLRTYPMRGNKRVDSPDDGTIYVVSVSGDKYYDQGPRDYTAVGLTRVSTYQTIDILSRESRLLYRSFDAAGHEVDRFAIDKAAASPRLARRGRDR